MTGPDVSRHQRAASDPAASVFVAAHAGSGKTHVLTSRIMRLLLAGVAPDTILCLTYTKAAAAEMVDRLSRTLGGWALMPASDLSAAITDVEGTVPDAARMTLARKLFARALETPGGLKIQTIHAFCERLLRRFPVEAQLAPSFTVLDEADARALQAEALAAALSAPPDSATGQAVARLAVEWADEDLAQRLSGLLAEWRRLPVDPLSAERLADAIHASRTAQGVGPGETVESARAAAAHLTPPEEDALRAAAAVLGRSGSLGQTAAQGLAAFLAAPASQRDVATLVAALLTGKGEPKKKLLIKTLQDSDPGAEGLIAQVQEMVRARAQHLQAVADAVLTDAVLTVGAAIEAHYGTAKADRGLLDFDDLIRRTRALLRTQQDALWVLYKLDRGIAHILIDEAQDTSAAQWDIITALADEFFAGAGAPHPGPVPRSLFVVGDEKQSIYSFQGAAPAQFAATRQRFAARAQGAVTFREVPLEVSFRSTPEVLSAVDRVFDGRARALSSSESAIRHIAFRTGARGTVSRWPLVTADPDDERLAHDLALDEPSPLSHEAKLARQIAEQVQGWLGRLHLPSRQRMATPGDILILLQRRGALQANLVRALKAAGVPVTGADRMELADHIAVMDLMALGDVALMPEDDLALAAVLKSPLCGLTEEALYALARGRTTSLWGALMARREDPVYRPAAAILVQARALADRVTPFGFYSEVLGALGGRRLLLGQLTLEASDPIEEFLNAALAFERRRVPSLQLFLAEMRAGASTIKRDLDDRSDAVRIMTVHGAKGLEAPVVVVADTTSKANSRKDPPILLRPDGVALKRKGAAAAAAEATQAAEDARAAESLRLLYVAMTRASDHLVTAGSFKKRRPGEGTWYSILEEALPATEPDTAAGGPLPTAPATAASAPRFPAWLHVPAHEPAPPAPVAPSQLGGGPASARAGASAGEDARLLRGRMIHRLLQALRGAADPRPAIAAAVARARLNPETAAEIEATVLAVLRDPAAAALLDPAAQCEVVLAGTLTDMDPPLRVRGSADLIVRRADGLLIADIKTDAVVPPGPEAVARGYLVQMALYRRLLMAAGPETPVSCALLWTSGPRVMNLPDALLDEVLAGLRPDA